MTRARDVLAAAAVAVPLAAYAGDAPRPIQPERMLGAATFEWTRAGARCRAVDAALVKKWAHGYMCMPPDDPSASASGKPLAATCTARKGRSEYLVFKLAADCAAERDTQAANGE